MNYRPLVPSPLRGSGTLPAGVRPPLARTSLRTGLPTFKPLGVEPVNALEHLFCDGTTPSALTIGTLPTFKPLGVVTPTLRVSSATTATKQRLVP